MNPPTVVPRVPNIDSDSNLYNSNLYNSSNQIPGIRDPIRETASTGWEDEAVTKF
jgi:hypothetical protein